jgi:hypothetical protein
LNSKGRCPRWGWPPARPGTRPPAGWAGAFLLRGGDRRRSRRHRRRRRNEPAAPEGYFRERQGFRIGSRFVAACFAESSFRINFKLFFSEN